jgi:hypothetical protein
MPASIVNVPGVSSLSADQLRSLTAAAKAIGVPADWLATIISFESGGSFSPRMLNRAGSGAFGLIQFMPSTAANLLGGTQADAVARGMAMGFDEQLQKMVVPYFQSFGRSFPSLQDMYLAVLYPALMGKPGSAVMGTAPSKVYTQNAALDKAGKGWITKDDITSTITNHYEKAGGSVPVPSSWAFLTIGAALTVAGLYLIQPYLPPEVRIPEPYLAPVRKAFAMAKKKLGAWSAILPLALLGLVSFGWIVAKGKA